MRGLRTPGAMDAAAWAAVVLCAVCSSWPTAAPAQDASPPELRGLELAGHAPAPDEPLYRERVALVVGIDRYEEPALRLRSARRGAEAVASVLRQEYGFDEVITLFDEEASRASVLRVLAGLRRLEPDDALLIFWAGHGATLRTAQDEELGYLVPWDGALQGEEALIDNISMEEIRSVVGLAIPARHKLLVVDACYGGLLTMRELPALPPEDSTWLKTVARQSVFQVLTAGEADQAVLDSGPGGHSIFTGRMLEALAEATDYVTATELAVTLQRRVRADAWARGSHEQTPAFGRISGTGDFVLLRAPRPDPSLGVGVDLEASAASGKRPASRGLAAVSAASLAVGVAGLVVAGVSRAEYVAAPLSDTSTPGLVHLNRAAGATGLAAVGLGAISFSAAVIVARW